MWANITCMCLYTEPWYLTSAVVLKPHDAGSDQATLSGRHSVHVDWMESSIATLFPLMISKMSWPSQVF